MFSSKIMKIRRLRIWIFIFSGSIILSLQHCKKEKDPEDINTEIKQIEKTIIATDGGTLSISDSTKLFIPPGALQQDGNVFLGYTGDEPSSIPNKNLEIVGNPITVRFPCQAILKPVFLSIPLPSSSVDTINGLVVLYNGSSYFPVEYTIEGKEIIISIDTLNWEEDGGKKGVVSGNLIVILARIMQTIPAKEMGIKKVLINNNTHEIEYNDPTANASSKVLLLIHGWTGDPSAWKEFLPWIMSDIAYSEYWTFGYNSSLSISENGEILGNLLSTYSHGAQIDIVAHSMGGLVARSMIEKNNGSKYIHKLITLGTPHEGSPLAVLRYAIGFLVGIDDPFLMSTYNLNTQGFMDLDPNSGFITEMHKLTKPPKPYYTISAINIPTPEPFSLITSAILTGLDDGVVSETSAHGVTGAISSGIIHQFDVGFAHLEMTSDWAIYKDVLSFLLKDTEIVTDAEGNVYKTVKIGTQTWMAENLKATKYNDGTAIPNVTVNATWAALTSGACSDYSNTPANSTTYGRLYNWYAVDNNPATNVASNGGKNVCPCRMACSF